MSHSTPHELALSRHFVVIDAVSLVHAFGTLP